MDTTPMDWVSDHKALFLPLLDETAGQYSFFDSILTLGTLHLLSNSVTEGMMSSISFTTSTISSISRKSI